MKINFYSWKLLWVVCAVIFLQGCDSDDDQNGGAYQSGVFVANEGGFGSGNATVTFYDPTSKIVAQNIFKNAGGLFAGDVLQSITLDGDNAYLVLNGSNAIEVVNNNTFKTVKTFTAPALDKPRYVEVIDDEAYISVWGPYDENYSLIDSYILVVDAKTYAVIDTIDTDEGVENMLYDGDHLFASNYNFGSSNSLAVIDPTDHSLVDQLTLAEGPAGMTLDVNNKLWVITTGTYEGHDGKLFRINPRW